MLGESLVTSPTVGSRHSFAGVLQGSARSVPTMIPQMFDCLLPTINNNTILDQSTFVMSTKYWIPLQKKSRNKQLLTLSNHNYGPRYKVKSNKEAQLNTRKLVVSKPPSSSGKNWVHFQDVAFKLQLYALLPGGRD